MNIPLKYGYFINLHSIAEAALMFTDKINTTINELTAIPNMKFHSRHHMVQMIAYTAGLFMSEDSFKEVESYLGDGVEALLRDFGGQQ